MSFFYVLFWTIITVSFLAAGAFLVHLMFTSCFVLAGLIGWLWEKIGERWAK